MHGNLNNEFSEYVNGADYITYIVLGSALNVLAVATLMNIGRALITELREGTLEMLLLSPAPRSEYFLGCLLEQTTRAFLEFGTVLIVGGLFGAKLSYFLSARALITILLAILSFFCMGILLSSVMLYTRDTYLTQNTLFVTMSLVCGITYPIQYLPDWVQNVAQIFPLTPAVTLFRNVVIGHENLISNHLLIIQILVLSGIYLVLGMIWYQSMERKLVAFGALIQEVWMFCCFCVFILFYTKAIQFNNILILPFVFLLLLLSSTIWGGMLNSIFMFSRDASIIMDIFDTPMTLFSGSRIPRNCFPFWAKMISLVFPLTYCINIIRFVLNIGGEGKQWILNIVGLLVCMCIMVAVTVVLTYQVERHNRETGELQLC